MALVLVTGLSGSGKSTVYRELVELGHEAYGFDEDGFGEWVDKATGPRAIMERLGHSTIGVTLGRYGHLFPSLDAALTDGLQSTYVASLAARTRR